MYIDHDTPAPQPAAEPQVAQTDTLLHDLRPRSLGALIDGAFRLYRRQFLTILAVVAVVSVPLQMFTTFTNFDSSSGFSVLAQASSISGILVYPAWAAVAVMIVGLLSGNAVGFRGAYKAVFQLWKPLLGLMMLLLLLWAVVYLPAKLGELFLDPGATSSLTLWSTFLELPYTILLVRLQVAVTAFVLEGLNPVAAIKRSWQLTRNYWWRTFGLLLIVTLILVAALLGPDLVLLVAANMLFHVDAATMRVLTYTLLIVIGSIIAPLVIIITTLYYLDLRVRKEGFDIQTAIMRQYPAPPPAPVVPTEAPPYGVQWHRPASARDETIHGTPENPYRVTRTRKPRDVE